LDLSEDARYHVTVMFGHPKIKHSGSLISVADKIHLHIMIMTISWLAFQRK
jgi:hypothetical protein